MELTQRIVIEPCGPQHRPGRGAARAAFHSIALHSVACSLPEYFLSPRNEKPRFLSVAGFFVDWVFVLNRQSYPAERDKNQDAEYQHVAPGKQRIDIGGVAPMGCRGSRWCWLQLHEHGCFITSSTGRGNR